MTNSIIHDNFSQHMLLHHGADIIRSCPMAPGVMSEECSEHQNKVWSKKKMDWCYKLNFKLSNQHKIKQWVHFFMTHAFSWSRATDSTMHEKLASKSTLLTFSIGLYWLVTLLSSKNLKKTYLFGKERSYVLLFKHYFYPLNKCQPSWILTWIKNFFCKPE